MNKELQTVKVELDFMDSLNESISPELTVPNQYIVQKLMADKSSLYKHLKVAGLPVIQELEKGYQRYIFYHGRAFQPRTLRIVIDEEGYDSEINY